MKKKTPTKKSDAVKTGTETASANSGALSNLLRADARHRCCQPVHTEG